MKYEWNIGEIGWDTRQSLLDPMNTIQEQSNHQFPIRGMTSWISTIAIIDGFAVVFLNNFVFIHRYIKLFYPTCVTIEKLDLSTGFASVIFWVWYYLELKSISFQNIQNL